MSPPKINALQGFAQGVCDPIQLPRSQRLWFLIRSRWNYLSAYKNTPTSHQRRESSERFVRSSSVYLATYYQLILITLCFRRLTEIQRMSSSFHMSPNVQLPLKSQRYLHTQHISFLSFPQISFRLNIRPQSCSNESIFLSLKIWRYFLVQILYLY